MDFHVKLKGIFRVAANSKLETFHRVMKAIDVDWPFVFSQDSFGGRGVVRTCVKCGGRLYKLPRVSPMDIKILGKQLGVHVKVKMFIPESKCFPPGKPVEYITRAIKKEGEAQSETG